MIELPKKDKNELATDQQWKAIHYPEGQSPILLSASAGSGKTRVLVDRVLSLLLRKKADENGQQDFYIDIDRLLVITFTHAAAQEMKEKIDQKMKQAINEEEDEGKKHQLIRQLPKMAQAQISTIHSFCLEVIHRFYYLIDLDPIFRQLTDEIEQNLIKENIWQDLREEYYGGEDREQFIALTQVFSSNDDDESLTLLLKNTYHLAVAQADPFSWVDQMDQLYESADEDSFYQTPLWQDLLWPQLSSLLDYNIGLIKSASQRLTDDDIFDSLREILAKDLSFYQALKEKLEGQEFDQGRALTLDYTFSRFPTIKSDDEKIIQIKDRVKADRDQAKAVIDKKFSKGIFIFDLQSHLAHAQEMKDHMACLKKVCKDFIKSYQRYKREHKLVDFNDLEHLAYDILQAKNDEGVAEAALYYQDRFIEILVDEYQDTNPLQEKIIQLISRPSPSNNRFMVGDVKQSIYRFRMAEPSLFMEKYESYQENPEEGQGQKIILQENFRSRPEVLQLTNFIFQQLMDEDMGEITYNQAAQLKNGYKDFPMEQERSAKFLIYEKAELEQPPFALPENAQYNFFSDHSKAEITLIAVKIKELIKQGFLIYDKKTGENRPIEWNDIVILSRTKKENAHIQSIFNLLDIPLVLSSTQNYFQSIEVSIMMSLLAIIDNPQQDIPLAAVLRSSMVGLDENDLASIRLASPTGNYFNALQAYIGQADEKDELGQKLNDFMDQLEGWRLSARRLSIAELIWQIYNDTAFLDYVGGLPGGEQRRANLHALYERALAYEQSQFKGLYKFIRLIERMRKRQDDLNNPMVLAPDQQAVQAMTIHNSKGLEFPVVFLLGFSSQINASDYTGDAIFDKDHGLALKYINLDQRYKADSLEQLALSEKIKAQSYSEELRVLYVALTRAEQQLFILGSGDSAEKLLQSWSKAEENQDLLIDAVSRMQASSVQDWLGMALYRYLNVTDSSYPQYKSKDKDKAPFNLTFYNKYDLYEQIADQQEDPKKGGWLEELQKEGGGKEQQELSSLAIQLMESDYATPLACRTTSFQSVSEIKRVFEDPNQEELVRLDESQPLGQNRYVVDELERPQFISEKLKADPAEVGQATHLLLQALDFSAIPTAEMMSQKRDELVQTGRLSAHLAHEIDLKKIEAFMQTDLAQRMVDAQDRLEKEVSFSLKLPAADIFEGINSEDDILIHGIIDGYFEEEGALVLFDYKTDQLGYQKESADQYLLNKYRGQIILYRLALENILNKKVKAAYLIGLDQTILVDVQDS